jgi:DNA adenine methylase
VVDVPRPFLKWAGGKGQLLPNLVASVQRAGGFARYHEPFVGGGALFFELYRLGLLPHGGRAHLSDTNPNLIEAYEGVKQDVEGLIERLAAHKARHGTDYYYAVRAEVPATLLDRAARVIYLNKTCFNGLYRENSKGQFNTPIGSYVNPNIVDEENLRATSRALKGVQITARPFEKVIETARPGDFVYFDPPYVPLSKTAYFTAYAKDGFGREDQERLAEVFRTLHERGVKVLLSNSHTPDVKRMYRGFHVERVMARRHVNSKGTGRGAIPEALVSNY